MNENDEYIRIFNDLCVDVNINIIGKLPSTELNFQWVLYYKTVILYIQYTK